MPQLLLQSLGTTTPVSPWLHLLKTAAWSPALQQWAEARTANQEKPLLPATQESPSNSKDPPEPKLQNFFF